MAALPFRLLYWWWYLNKEETKIKTTVLAGKHFLTTHLLVLRKNEINMLQNVAAFFVIFFELFWKTFHPSKNGIGINRSNVCR